jgi:hypothetical protein
LGLHSFICTFKHTTEITALQDNQPVSHSISSVDLGCYFHFILTFLYILISEIARGRRFQLHSIEIHKSKRLSGNSLSRITFSIFFSFFFPKKISLYSWGILYILVLLSVCWPHAVQLWWWECIFVNIRTFVVKCHLLSEYSFGRQLIKYYFWCNALWVLLIKKTYFTVKPCGTFSFGPVWSFPVQIKMYNRLMITTVFPHHQWITAVETWKPIAWTRPWAVLQVRNWFDFEWRKQIYLLSKMSRQLWCPLFFSG